MPSASRVRRTTGLWAGIPTVPSSIRTVPNPLLSGYRCADDRWVWLLCLEGDRHWPNVRRALDLEHLAVRRDVDVVRGEAEEMMAFAEEHGLPVSVVRPFNIYGPNQIGVGAIHHFVRHAIAGDEITVHNDGAQIRAWCYMDDIAAAVCFLASNEAAYITGHVLAVNGGMYM